MENIAEKIKVLNYSEEMSATLPKFLGTLVAKDPATGEDLVTVEEETQIINYLQEKGISLRPTHLKVLAEGFPYIKNAVEEMERIGELKMYVDDPGRMTSRDNVNRILYLRNNGIEYKSPEGKYSKLAYSKRAFEAEFGVIDLDAERAKHSKSKATEDGKKEARDKKQTEQAPVIEEASEDKIVIKGGEADKGPKDIKPVSPIKPHVTAKEDKKDNRPSAITIDETAQYTGALDLAGLEASFNTPGGKTDNDATSSDEQKHDEKATLTSSNYAEILSEPQVAALTDETFERFESLTDSVRRVLTTVYNITEVSDAITDNLVKLIAAGVASDSDVLYEAITYGKEVTEEEAQQLKDSIEEELEYIKIFDLDTDNQGRAKAA